METVGKRNLRLAGYDKYYDECERLYEQGKAVADYHHQEKKFSSTILSEIIITESARAGATRNTGVSRYLLVCNYEYSYVQVSNT